MKKTDKIPSREQGMSEKVKYCQKVVRAGNKLKLGFLGVGEWVAMLKKKKKNTMVREGLIQKMTFDLCSERREDCKFCRYTAKKHARKRKQHVHGAQGVSSLGFSKTSKEVSAAGAS